MNQKNKIIAPSKNTFQNMKALQNYSLKKMHFKTDVKTYLIKESLTDEHK